MSMNSACQIQVVLKGFNEFIRIFLCNIFLNKVSVLEYFLYLNSLRFMCIIIYKNNIFFLGVA